MVILLQFAFLFWVVFVIVLPIGILAWFLYVCSALDKYVNAQNYPDLVDRGVWRV